MALQEIGARLRLQGASSFRKDADRAAGGLDRLGRQAGQASRQVSGLERAAERSRSALGSLGKKAALGLAGLTAGAVAGGIIVMRDSIQHAADLGETLSKVNNIFGESAGSITAWSKTAAKSFGLSQQEALAAAAQYGDMFQQLGFTQDAAVDNSKALVKMSADLGSFHNVDPTDVLDRIGASMRGEYDSLQALIPNINAARVEHEALIKTGKKTAKELTAQEKAAATLAIIHKDGALAADDFAETSDGLTNQQRILKAQMNDTKAAIGRGLLPVMTELATWVNDNAVPAFQRFVEQFERGVGPGGELKDTLKDIGDALKDAWPAVKNVVEKTVDFVRFLAKHPDAVKTFAIGVAAYATAMKAAATWTAAMAGIDLLKLATGIGAVNAAGGAGAAGGVAGAAGKGGKLAKAGRAAGIGGIIGSVGGIIDSAWIDKQGRYKDTVLPDGRISRFDGKTGQITILPAPARPKMGKPPRSGDSNRQPMGLVLTPRVPAPRKAVSAQVAPASPVPAPKLPPVVVQHLWNGKVFGEMVIDDLENRAARR
jgi:hypothetical protein